MKLINKGAEGVSYFTPEQCPPAGTAIVENGVPVPLPFTTLRLRGVTFQNRLWVSPMCQYSAEDGLLNDYHLVHLGQFALRGASNIVIEASAVTPEGRISPEDSGIWKDEHIAPLKRIGEFIHSQGQKFSIQLAHAGRKASTVAPFIGHGKADNESNGWPDDVYGPTPEPWSENMFTPHELSKDQIKGLVAAFVAAARRSLYAGVDYINLHAAHGYLLHEFYSPASNHRTDEYGGSFENRVRFPMEVIHALRRVMPEDMPLVVRISASDWIGDRGWGIDDSVELVKLFAKAGVDLVEASSGGNDHNQNIALGPGYQVHFAAQLKKSVPEMKIATVGIITNAKQSKKILDDGQADAIMMAREFLRNANAVLDFAKELDVKVRWPQQYNRAQLHK